MTLVSVIMPNYNCERFLLNSIESVINQTFFDWELIIVDDCSSDNGIDIVKEYQKKDKRIQLFKNTFNSGAAVCRNTAIEKAKGRFIAFLDSDDVWTSDKLEKQVSFMLTNNYYFTFTEYMIFDELGIRIGNKDGLPLKVNYENMLDRNYIGCLTAIYDSQVLGKILMPEIRKRQDYGLWLKILKKVDYAYCLKEPLAYYRLRGSSISSNKFSLIKYNWILFRKVEKFSIWKSVFYLFKNIISKILK